MTMGYLCLPVSHLGITVQVRVRGLTYPPHLPLPLTPLHLSPHHASTTPFCFQTLPSLSPTLIPSCPPFTVISPSPPSSLPLPHLSHTLLLANSSFSLPLPLCFHPFPHLSSPPSFFPHHANILFLSFHTFLPLSSLPPSFLP